MPSSRKLIALAVCLALGGSAFAKTDDKPKDSKPKDEKAAKKDGDKKDSDKKDADKKKKDDKSGKSAKSDKSAPAPTPDGAPKKLTIPLVEGHDSKGLKIPYYGADGKLQMIFTISLANKVDPDHVRMEVATLETFDAEGQPEMTIDMPQSVLDLNTRVISTDKSVTIKRSDFEITGKSMQFDTEARRGKIAGDVRMLIYNLSDETEDKPDPKKEEKDDKKETPPSE